MVLSEYAIGGVTIRVTARGKLYGVTTYESESRTGTVSLFADRDVAEKAAQEKLAQICVSIGG